MNIYLIAGEASGDLHGSNLIKAMHRLDPSARFRCWGGDLMEAAGGELVRHYRDLAFMGFVEVLLNLKTILGNLEQCKRDILQFKPEVVVLIDYPGFNLRIAKWLRKQKNAGKLSCKVVYYISPQIWAWHQSRIHSIKRDIDQMLVILPFEAAFYQQHNFSVEFVGHPLLDVLPHPLYCPVDPKRIALLPGSRAQEVKKMLPTLLEVTSRFPDYQFEVAASPALPKELYRGLMAGRSNVQLVSGDTYGLLSRAQVAVVKSGTSTLETALIGTPQVVCYSGNRLSFEIARRIVDLKYISLVNLIADAPVVEELIQVDFTVDRLEAALRKVLEPRRGEEVKTAYQRIRALLGESGASERAARAILQMPVSNQKAISETPLQ